MAYTLGQAARAIGRSKTHSTARSNPARFPPSEARTIRVWSAATAAETARLEIDAPVASLVAIAPNRLVAGDKRGLLHWLEIVD